MIVGLFLMMGAAKSLAKPPSGNPYDFVVAFAMGAGGLWMVVNHLITGKKWSKWVSRILAILLVLMIAYLGYRIQSNIESNKKFGNVLRKFADDAEKTPDNGTLPKFKSPGDGTVDKDIQVMNDMLQETFSVMDRMNKELDSVGDKPVYDLSVLSSKTSLKAEIQKRIESYHIIQKWQPELPRAIFDAISKKVDSYNRPDKQEIIRAIEGARPTFVHQSETMCNLLAKKQTAEQAYLSFMASKDYQFKDGKVFFRTQTAAQSEQYRALMQRIEDSTNEMEAFRQQWLSEVKKKAEKFGQ